MKKKMSIIFPSNRPDAFFGMFAPSLFDLFELSDVVDLTFVMVYQGKEWTKEKVKMAEEVMYLDDWKFITIHQPKMRGMTLSRSMGIDVMDCDYFMQTDDDVIFKHGTLMYPYSSGKRFAQCIEYFERFPKCGFIMCCGSLGGSVQCLEISSTTTGFFGTHRGLIYRYIPGHKYYGGALANIGSLQDTVITYGLLEKGYYGAKQFNNPTIHRTTIGKGGRIANAATGGELLHDRKTLLENNQKYIQDRYDDPVWEYQERKLPKKLKEMYTAAGGDPEVFEIRKYKLNF